MTPSELTAYEYFGVGLSYSWKHNYPQTIAGYLKSISTDATLKAVFVEPFLSYVLDGSKTIESRFSINQSEPYRRVSVGDILLVKGSGGPIVAVAEVKQTAFYRLDRTQLESIRERFGEALRVEDESFWDDRKASCFATIVELATVTPIAPVVCDKRDKRGWVRLRYQPRLLFG